MPVANQAEVFEDIVKSQSDDRSYKGIVLENGLKVWNADDASAGI